MTKSDQELGRRERNKLEKQTRIFDAAAELFAEKGYSAVTTQEIADRADVAGGTGDERAPGSRRGVGHSRSNVLFSCSAVRSPRRSSNGFISGAANRASPVKVNSAR